MAATSTLVLDLADARGMVDDIELEHTTEPMAVTVEMVDTSGQQVGVPVDGGVPPAPEPRRLRAPLPDPVGGVEGMSQTVRLPVPATLGELREISLVFDAGVGGAVRVERIALGR